MKKTLIAVCLVASCLTACADQPKVEEVIQSSPVAQAPQTLQEAIQNPARLPENKARDVYRHPLETLQFFGIKPNMTVVEITPGTGWYTEILAPFLQTQGKYIAAIVPPEKGAYAKKTFDTLDAWVKAAPGRKVEFATFSPKDSLDITQAGSADMVLTFRNVHNWTSAGFAEQAFVAFHRALKPGGILGVVEHRQNEKAKIKGKDQSGYVKTSEVIALAKKAGFVLEAQSEINANPKDTKNHPEGVWTLPPTLALKEKDKAKYLAIGESDRMTLKFVKVK